MRNTVIRQKDPLGIQSSSTIENGVFTNPQAKSNHSKRGRSNKRHQINLREESSFSLGDFPTAGHQISSALSQSKRKSSIRYLNKQYLSATYHRESEDKSHNRNKMRNGPINLQRSLSKRRQDFEKISASGSDLNPRRLTPSSGETIIDSNSEEIEEDNRSFDEINRSNSFHKLRLENHLSSPQKQRIHVSRSPSKHGRIHDGIVRLRQRQKEQEFISQSVSLIIILNNLLNK